MSVIYGSSERPRFERERGITLVVPQREAEQTIDGKAVAGTIMRLTPDAVRELVIGGIHALEDEAYQDEAEGFPNSSATLAYRYLKEAVLRQEEA